MAWKYMLSTQVPSIEVWKEQGHTFSFRGHNIFYRDTGETEKPVLVLLHGFPTSSWDWKDLWGDLQQRFRLICFDFIGFGLSDKPKNLLYSLHLQADLVEVLLKFLDVSQYHLLVHDYGVSVAQELIAREKEHLQGSILSCIFLNGGLFPETHKPVLIQKLLLGPFGGLVARFASRRKLKANFDRICARPMSDEELSVHWRLMEAQGGRKVVPKIIQYMKERTANRARWVGALNGNSFPICLINGLDDPISGWHMLERYRELVDDPSVYALEGIGHYPQNEAPADVLLAANDFWSAMPGQVSTN